MKISRQRSLRSPRRRPASLKALQSRAEERKRASEEKLRALDDYLLHQGGLAPDADSQQVREEYALLKADYDALLQPDAQERGALEDSLHRYANLFDFAPVGYAVLDR